MKINRYFNAPIPCESENHPVICVGVNFSAKEGERPVMRFIVKRDLRIKITSLTINYRFSALPLSEVDGDNPYHRFVCTREDLNRQEYIVIRGNYTENEIPTECIAAIASVTLENGETISYKPDEFLDPACNLVTTDRTTVSPALDGFFRYRSAEQKNTKKTAVDSLIARAASVLNEDADTKNKAIRLRRRFIARRMTGTLVAAAVVIALVLGVIIYRNLNRPVENPLQTAASALLADGRYGDAYKIVLDNGDKEILQSVCRTAADHYKHIKDYKTAYLYACAAPEPFDNEIIDAFIEILLNQNRQEEAYKFLLTLPQYTEAMQRVCVSAVDAFLERQEFDKAYFYAANAPESLEAYVLQQSSGQIMEEGEFSDTILESLGQTDDPQKFNEMASWAAESLSESGSYIEAASVANRINDPEKRSAVLESICLTGMKAYVEASDLNSAIVLYTDCSAGMKEEAASNIRTAMLDHAKSIENAAGILYFGNMIGEDTSALAVSPWDSSIKRNGIVWQYMTTEQKRVYHARTMDLYKEAFRIEDGTVEGITDAVSIAVSEHIAVVLLNNGTVKAISNNGRNVIPTLPADNDIVAIDAGHEHVVLLHADGTVTTAGNASKGQNNTSSWTDVVKVAAGEYFTAALRSDGTVYACGSNASGQCNVAGISGVIDIAACDNTLVLHMSDNTLRLVGDISMGLQGAVEFADIARVRAGGNCILAETGRGTYILAHASYNASAGLVLTWKNMPDFAAGFLCVGAIDKEGNMLIVGDGTSIVHDGYEPGIQ